MRKFRNLTHIIERAILNSGSEKFVIKLKFEEPGLLWGWNEVEAYINSITFDDPCMVKSWSDTGMPIKLFDSIEECEEYMSKYYQAIEEIKNKDFINKIESL